MGNSTSHQRNDRVFGEFKCPACNRQWTSGCSWANTYQKCKRCGLEVYPYKQRPLTSGADGLDLNKPHPKELCGRCLYLGRRCTDPVETPSCTIL